MDLPQTHKEAIGLAYVWAVGASTPWDCINNTGTLIVLIKTSVNHARNAEDNRVVSTALTNWMNTAPLFGSGGDKQMQEHNTLIAYTRCREICVDIGQLAYKYGSMPKGGFSITRITQTTKE